PRRGVGGASPPTKRPAAPPYRWGATVLQPRERLRILEGLSGDPADLGPAGCPRRHRPRDPYLPAGRDRDALLSRARPHARPSHGIRRPRRGGLPARRDRKGT